MSKPNKNGDSIQQQIQTFIYASIKWFKQTYIYIYTRTTGPVVVPAQASLSNQ